MEENNNNWQQRLRNLKASEEDMPLFETAWQHAESKLGFKRKRTNMKWYVAAAALLVLVFISISINRELSPLDEEIVVTHPLLPPTSQELPGKHGLTGTEKIHKVVARDVKHNTVKPVQQEPIQPDTNVNFVWQPISLRDSLSTQSVVQVQVKKKKLQTVHVNELPDAEHPVNTTANHHYQLQPAFREFESPVETPSHSIHLNNNN